MGYVSKSEIINEISLNMSLWMPYMLGTVNFDPLEIKYATQSKLDLINFVSAQRVNVMNGAGLDDNLS